MSQRGRGRGRGRGDSNNYRGRDSHNGRGNYNRSDFNSGGGRGGILGPAPGQQPLDVELVTNFFQVDHKSIKLNVYRVDFVNPIIPEDRLSKSNGYFLHSLLAESEDLGWTISDGKHTLYAVRDLGKEKTFTLSLDREQKKPKTQDVSIKKTKTLIVSLSELNEETVTVLELYMRKSVSPSHAMIRGRGVYDLSKAVPMENTVFACISGFAHAFSKCKKGLLIAVDVVHQITIQDLPLDGYLLLRAEQICKTKFKNLSEAMNSRAWNRVIHMVGSELRNKRFRLSHFNYPKKKTLISFSNTTARSQTFETTDENGTVTKVTVEEYYRKVHGVKLRGSDSLPLVITKNSRGDEYYPLELCRLLPGQTPLSLSLDERSAAITATRKELSERFDTVCRYVGGYQQMKDDVFSMSINPAPVAVKAKILAPPFLIYRSERVAPKDGSWAPKAFLTPQTPQTLRIKVIYFNRFRNEQRKPFEDELERVANQRGVHFQFLPSGQYTEERNFSMKEVDELRRQLISLKKEHKASLFALVIMSEKDGRRYPAFKYLLDVEMEIPSQVVLKKNCDKRNNATFTNIVAAINVKLPSKVKGENATVDLNFKMATSVIGIDVNHPPVGTNRPSEAAISGSLNPRGTNYFSTSRTQKARQESIPDIGGMFKELLDCAKEKGIPPFARFIILRDGVADSQFEIICQQELEDFRQAVREHPYYAKSGNVEFLYIIAQKRNITRLANKEGRGKPPAGTVVDSVITGIDSKDFYLVSHKAIQGSTKPIHYHVFCNDMKMPLLDIENLLFHLSHLHPGCTRSVSLPMPLYNAHKLAYRVGQVYRPALELLEEQRSDRSHRDPSPIVLPDSIKLSPFFL